MNSITLSEHRCANKCTEFKKTGEQCSHCLVKQQETVSENNQDSQAVLNLEQRSVCYATEFATKPMCHL